jgi:NTP pyrophosphatase (non-canonical NTP hydrolase)
MLKNNKKIAREVFSCNTKEYNIQKCIEELQELSLALTQQLNKPSKDYKKEIIDEIGDVKIRLLYLTDTYGKKIIKERIKMKLIKFKKNVINRRYSN